ncbi:MULTISPECIES: ExbD/TolR family protein [Hydrogenophaga]|uniref:Biopolymer transport protein ExbD/TolR n=1 Tax=Hydrogenophaga intermedia TaxID=65786 RepID=A0A1L1PW42_HYDIT|nr:MULTISPECIES: ExbD/TolR family protein [Hydrogenophaga]AOS78771.1 protein TolR [Hydrogenophaga sp. PBC]TMU73800.1 ExbD/TolR family protein [Hydrogenophaga intermedia]CDN90226.1 Biopolymer transport protein ExbD/TolR [Hydrogenophaga intermedia]
MAKLAARGRGRRTMNEINMVPFIDVMLVLLIIFMVTAPLITPSQIALPTVGQAQRQPDRFVQVVIDKSEQLRVREGSASGEGALVPLNLLAARVLELQGTGADQAGVPVIISADKTVQYDAVVRTMNELQKAGVQRVGLSVQTTR